MSYTSEHGRWYDIAPDAFDADEPVAAHRAQKLVNNVNHLRDVTTHTRISRVARVGETVGEVTVLGDKWVLWYQQRIPWTVLGPRTLATPVLRVGAFRDSAGTSHMRAGLFPVGVRYDANNRNALASWGDVSFTDTTSAVIIESEAAIEWPATTTTGRGVLPRVSAQGLPASMVKTMTGSDPRTDDGVYAPTAVDVVMLQLVLFARGSDSVAEDDLSLTLVELREYGGGTP